jgi:hypothetical protein
MNERATEIYAYMYAMMGVLSAMSETERSELEKWEKENLDGHSIGTSDWPGWEKYIGPKPRFEDRSNDRIGFIYLIRSGDTNRYKIGISKNVPSRLNTLQTENPEKLSLIRAFPAIDALKLEQELHSYFAEQRFAGEWYVLDEQDLEYVLSIAECVPVTLNNCKHAVQISAALQFFQCGGR